MANIKFEGHFIEIASNETLLDLLLQQGHDIAYGCRKGTCHACVLITDDSSASLPFVKESQKLLAGEEQRLNHILACQCFISQCFINNTRINDEDLAGDINFSRIEKSKTKETVLIIEKKWLNESVVYLRLKSTLKYRPGQYVAVSVLNENIELTRTYSIASHSCYHDYIELHIKYIETGHFSGLLKDKLNVGDALGIYGPMGKCIYSAKSEQTLLLTAIGTGLGPIYGILLDALEQSHCGDIHLVLGAKTLNDFYFMDELREISDSNSNVNLHFVSMDFGIGNEGERSVNDLHEGDVYEYLGALFSDMKNIKVYLCGAESFVKKMRRQAFMNGASMADIRTDTFLPFDG